MRLVLIRHGEAEAGLRGVIAGQAGCTGLTEHGVDQARALADRLRASGELDDCRTLLSSPLARARQTALVLAEALPAAAVEEVPDLCELLPGEADGLTWQAYEERYGRFDRGELDDALMRSPDRPFAPGGESWNTFRARVRSTLRGLADRFPADAVAAVSHAGFIMASILVIFDIPRPGTGARLDPDHTSLTIWHVEGAAWRLERYNDAYHLR